MDEAVEFTVRWRADGEPREVGTVPKEISEAERRAVARQLKEQGWDRAARDTPLGEPSLLESESTGPLIIAAAVATAGGAATLVTYAAAQDAGGAYYVFWGAPAFAAVKFFQALTTLGTEGGVRAETLILTLTALSLIVASAATVAVVLLAG